MITALTHTYDLLRQKDAAQKEEEKELDRQLQEYEAVLVSSTGSGRRGKRGETSDVGFKQVVEDMGRVKREMEECRKDLRRLGWTGD